MGDRLREVGHPHRRDLGDEDLAAGRVFDEAAQAGDAAFVVRAFEKVQEAVKKGLDKVKVAGGNSPLGAAIDAAAADFEKAGGTAVIVIVSDGTQNNMDDAIILPPHT